MNPKALKKRLTAIKERLNTQYGDEVVFVERPLELNGLFSVNGEAMPGESIKEYLSQERFRKSVIFIDDIPREDGIDEVYWGLDDDYNVIFYANQEEFFEEHRAGQTNL